MSLRAELIEMQTQLARLVASLPDEKPAPAKRRKKRGVRQVDPANLPGPAPTPLDMARHVRLIKTRR